MSNNFLFTGGSGFIGSYFHKVIPHEKIINLDLVPPITNFNSNYIKGDIRNLENLDRAIEGNNIGTIISLAAMHHDFGISEKEYFDTNETGIKKLCEAATKYNISTIVLYSSVAVYGPQPDKVATTEETTPYPNTPYGASKLAGEKVLEKWASEEDIRKVLIIRPTLVIGINNKANMYKLIHQIHSGIYFHIGKGNNIKSIAQVDNIVIATMYLLDNLKQGVTKYNYADEPQLTSKEIANFISNTFNKKIRITLPKFLGIMLGLPFDLLIKITGKNLPISSDRVKKLTYQNYHSANKLFSSGYKPKYDVKESLKKMVEWYKNDNIDTI